MTPGTLWPFAVEVHGRPGVEAVLHELQDDHGQCVPYLLWSLWSSAERRWADDRALAAAAELARAWQDAAVAPLRTLRRDLKHPPDAAPRGVWERLRGKVKALELEAERMLLQMLEAAAPAPGAAAIDPRAGLARAVGAWGGAPPAELLDRLTATAV